MIFRLLLALALLASPASAQSITQSNYVVQSVGAWTPAITFATPGDLAVAYTTQVGYYIKTGRMVTLSAQITTSSFTWSTASGTFQITGLPFTASATPNIRAQGAVDFQGITKANYTQLNINISQNAATILFNMSAQAQTRSNVVAADLPSGGTVVINLTINYITN